MSLKGTTSDTNYKFFTVLTINTKNYIKLLCKYAKARMSKSVDFSLGTKENLLKGFENFFKRFEFFKKKLKISWRRKSRLFRSLFVRLY